jgi:hypothetical protein
MVAGLNVFFIMVIVLSDTEAAGVGVKRVVGGVVVTGVGGTGVGVTAGCAGDDSKHPQVIKTRKAMKRRTAIDLIVAGLRLLYNKVMGNPDPLDNPYLRHGTAGPGCGLGRT